MSLPVIASEGLLRLDAECGGGLFKGWLNPRYLRRQLRFLLSNRGDSLEGLLTAMKLEELVLETSQVLVKLPWRLNV